MKPSENAEADMLKEKLSVGETTNTKCIHFNDMPYKRVAYEEIEARYQALFRKLEAASREEEFLAVLKEHYKLLEDMTPIDLCYVRHDMDLNDSFYAAEQSYYDEINPKISELYNRFYRLVAGSPFCSCFKELVGDFGFSVIKANLDASDSRLISLQQEENTLSNQYSSLVANGKALYNDQLVRRSSLAAEQQSPDRETRRSASYAIAQSWEEQRGDLEDIYDKLVQNRTKQAKTMGFKSYVELGYLQMKRFGYTPDDVRCFREQVKRYVVPIAAAINERHKKRLGLDHLYSFDSCVSFLNGNPVPLGDDDFCLEMTRKMYSRLSPETEEYINFIMDNGLYDVKIRDGKRGGGYCMELSAYHAPFIFANFDGTGENAYIMSHEGGHAFFTYLKRNEEIRERCQYTSEMAETHAMAMEFFVDPYMELFFGERADDYRQLHLEQAFSRIIYQCQQDEFQQIVYEQPQLTKQQRNEVWERLEREYFPYREYTDEEKRRIGHRWQCIPHLYHWPFYAIDYALAQVCALQYYQRMNKDFGEAWQSYLTFCRASGRLNFPEAVKAAGLDSPFEEGGLNNLMDWLQTQLNA